MIELRHDEATVDLHGNRLSVSTVMTPEATPGDWVLIHAGFAIQKLEPEEALETWKVLNDLQAAGTGGET